MAIIPPGLCTVCIKVVTTGISGNTLVDKMPEEDPIITSGGIVSPGLGTKTLFCTIPKIVLKELSGLKLAIVPSGILTPVISIGGNGEPTVPDIGLALGSTNELEDIVTLELDIGDIENEEDINEELADTISLELDTTTSLELIRLEDANIDVDELEISIEEMTEERLELVTIDELDEAID
jgi:hypothetical protein